MALAPPSGSRPACAGLPFDHDGKTPHALAGGLELARRAERGFHDERPLGNAGEAPDVPGRVRTTYLLVGVHENHRSNGGLQV